MPNKKQDIVYSAIALKFANGLTAIISPIPSDDTLLNVASEYVYMEEIPKLKANQVFDIQDNKVSAVDIDSLPREAKELIQSMQQSKL